MNNAAEYNAQARINPVYLTAKTAVCLMAQAGIPDAEAVVRALGLENNEPLQAMPDDDTILGNALVVEAKYRTMCRLIEKSGYKTCVDLPCGYTPKALHLTEQGRQFIGLDLPIVVQEVAPILRNLAKQPERMAFYGVDATNLTSLETALQGVEGPLCITTEGMLMYFTDDEVIAVIANIRALLEKYGGCWITPDPEFVGQFFRSFRAILGEKSLDKLKAARNAAKGQSDVEDLGNVFILKPTDGPDDIKRAELLLAKYGLKAEKVNLAEEMPELNIYEKLTIEQISRFQEEMRNCHYWLITLAEGERGQNTDTLTQQPFMMKYTVEKEILQVSLTGRLDSISAPQFLMAWEEEKADKPIAGVSIDCTNLEYISSAGIRLLQEMQKNCHQGIRFTGVNPSVAQILQQKGLDG